MLAWQSGKYSGCDTVWPLPRHSIPVKNPTDYLPEKKNWKNDIFISHNIILVIKNLIDIFCIS